MKSRFSSQLARDKVALPFLPKVSNQCQWTQSRLTRPWLHSLYMKCSHTLIILMMFATSLSFLLFSSHSSVSNY